MIPLSSQDMQIMIAATIFTLGCLCVLLGAIVLVTRGYSRELKTIAAQSAKLGQKGLAQDVTSLVKSATELVGAINGLVRTASCVGITLITLGASMIVASYWVLRQIDSIPG